MSGPNIPVVPSRGRFCPICGGASVDFSDLAGGNASCKICTWRGRADDLVTFVFEHATGDPEEIVHRLFMDARNILGSREYATALAGLLSKWGFLDVVTDKNKKEVSKQLARYLAGAAQAVVQSFIRTREQLEKERHATADA